SWRTPPRGGTARARPRPGDGRPPAIATAAGAREGRENRGSLGGRGWSSGQRSRASIGTSEERRTGELGRAVWVQAGSISRMARMISGTPWGGQSGRRPDAGETVPGPRPRRAKILVHHGPAPAASHLARHRRLRSAPAAAPAGE